MFQPQTLIDFIQLLYCRHKLVCVCDDCHYFAKPYAVTVTWPTHLCCLLIDSTSATAYIYSFPASIVILSHSLWTIVSDILIVPELFGFFLTITFASLTALSVSWWTYGLNPSVSYLSCCVFGQHISLALLTGGGQRTQWQPLFCQTANKMWKSSRGTKTFAKDSGFNLYPLPYLKLAVPFI